MTATLRLNGFRHAYRTRLETLRQRLAMGVLLAGIYYMTIGTTQSWLWLTGCCLSQLAEGALIRRAFSSPARFRRLGALLPAATMLATAAYVYPAIPLWAQNNAASKVGAFILLAGSLLFLTIKAHRSILVYAAGALPGLSLYVFLPLRDVVRDPSESRVMLLAGTAAFGVYMAALAVDQRRTTGAMLSALRAAWDARVSADKANEAKSEFLAVMSHEIRTPMNAVVAAAHLLEEDKLSDSARRTVRMLRNASQTMMALLNDLLDFSKLEAGRMSVETVALRPREVLDALEAIWRPALQSKGVAFSVSLNPALPEQVQGDPMRLQQILSNLLSNAAKFTEEGAVSVEARWSEAEGLCVSVADSGVGIAPERLERIFERYEQADADTARRFGGTGLGLAISRQLAEAMGGALTAVSALGEGSRFTLRVPAPAIESPAPQLASGAVDLSGLRVLAADDNEVNRMVLEALLSPLGCALTLVADGAAAVEAARRDAFDVILLDMRMPGLDGLEAAQRIRAGARNPRTPIVALSANALERQHEQWRTVSAAAYLTKPVDPKLLSETLRRAAGRDATAAASGAASAVTHG